MGNLNSQSETMNSSTPVDELKTVSSASEMQNRKSVSDNTLRSSALTDKQEDPNGTVSNTDTKDNDEKSQNQKSNKRKYNSLDRVTINGEEHVISEAGTYVVTNDNFYTLEKDGQTVYEDISQDELE